MVILPVESHRLVGPEKADQLDRLAEASKTLAVVRPLHAERALVEVLAGADPEDHPSWKEHPQGAKGLRDYRRVVAKCRRYDRRAERDARSALARGCEPRQRERRMAVGVAPRLEMVAHENRIESIGFGRDCEIQQLARSELLGGGLVTEPEIQRHARDACSSASS